MPAKSQKQQQFMGMVHQCQKTGKCASKEVEKTAKSMKKKDVKDFASTKHKGLPKKIKEMTTKKIRYIKDKNGKKVRQVWVDGLQDWMTIPESIEEQSIRLYVRKILNKIS